MNYTPTVVFDFDGVIHSYVSGWQGATNTPDPPVQGIREAVAKLRQLGYKVVVVSTRCGTHGGKAAVERYLHYNGIDVDEVTMDKPPALCYIDDRAIRFDGHPEDLVKQVVNFKTWLEGPTVNNEPVQGLRPCKAALYERGGRREVVGRFHRWGVNYEEFETGPGNFTTAIIELADGSVVSCAAETVQFLDREDRGG